MADYRKRPGSANWHSFAPAAFATLARNLRRKGDRRLALIARLVLMTGARHGEVELAEWDDINFDRREWTIKAARSTTIGRRIPLSDSAIRVLLSLRRIAGQDFSLVGQQPQRALQNLRGATVKAGAHGASLIALRQEAMARAGRRGASAEEICSIFGCRPEMARRHIPTSH
jgi:integrase